MNLEKLNKAFEQAYEFMYENGTPKMFVEIFETCAKNKYFKMVLADFAKYREDVISSDRECAAFILAYMSTTEQLSF